MMLSQASKYALRAAIYLAERPEGNHLSRDIAAGLAVPAQYLAKILQDLVRAGLLTSAKGRGGGFRLALPAQSISLMQVVHAIEGDRYAQGCVLGLPRCSDTEPCALHEVWKRTRSEFVRALETTLLVDLSAARATAA